MKFKFKFGQLVCLKSKYHNSIPVLRRKDKPIFCHIRPGQIGIYIANYNRSKTPNCGLSGPKMVVLFGEDMVEVEHKYLSVLK